jgi:Tol biopolymer transport system component
MTQHDDLDQLLTAWLDDPYTPPAPHYLSKVLERSRRTRQRPAWTSLERWLPMADRIPRAALAPPIRLALLVLIVVLVAAVAAGVAVVGARLLDPTRPIDKSRAPYPIPKGGAAVIVFDAGDANASQETGDIYTVRADGTDLRQLTSGPDVESLPVFSPDGERIAYRLKQNGSDSVAIMDGGGGSRKTLFSVSQPGCLGTQLGWSPDGSSIVFSVSVACDGQNVLELVATDGASPATALVDTPINADSAAWSPNGAQIALAGTDPKDGSSGLYVVDVDPAHELAGGLQPRLISSPTGPTTTSLWMTPRWSPDGTTVAAAAGTDSACDSSAGTLDVFVVKADGSGQRAVAAETAKEYDPTWSPDGLKLAFLRIVDPSEDVNGRPCTVAMWVANADGSNAHRVPGLGTDPGQSPFWSPDGTRLLGNTVRVVGGNEHYDMYIVTIDGSSPTVTIDDVDIATWQPLAAPLPSAPSFPAVSPSP